VSPHPRPTIVAAPLGCATTPSALGEHVAVAMGDQDLGVAFARVWAPGSRLRERVLLAYYLLNLTNLLVNGEV
jgi:hypothetical protein